MGRGCDSFLTRRHLSPAMKGRLLRLPPTSVTQPYFLFLTWFVMGVGSRASAPCPFHPPTSHSPTYPSAYPTDITVKVWESPLVLEGTARSRSEVREDGTYGVTFDLERIVKGTAPLLRRRKQFRLQFLESSSVGGVVRTSPIPQNRSEVWGGGSGGGCVPPTAAIKTGRKYYVFASKTQNHFLPIFSPELLNRKNTKAIQSLLCHNCGESNIIKYSTGRFICVRLVCLPVCLSVSPFSR